MALNDSSCLDISENIADVTGDSEKDAVVTMMDVLQEQAEFEDNANAVLGASDDKNCTYSKGYIKRQALYACLTCCNPNSDGGRAGVCLACSLTCHENHELIELYTKRNFCCDCGTPNFPQPCQFPPERREYNSGNKYNHNFQGIYCTCRRPYPDPDIVDDDEEEMIQCIVCEDWLHVSHLEAVVPDSEQYSEMICKDCMNKNDFLHDYTIFAVGAENLAVRETLCTTETKTGLPESEDGDVNIAGMIENPKDSSTVNNEEINVKQNKHINEKDVLVPEKEHEQETTAENNENHLENDVNRSAIKEAENSSGNTFDESTSEEHLDMTANAAKKSTDNNIEEKRPGEEKAAEVADTDIELSSVKIISEKSHEENSQTIIEGSNVEERQESNKLDQDALVKDLKQYPGDHIEDSHETTEEIVQNDTNESTDKDTLRSLDVTANEIDGSVINKLKGIVSNGNETNDNGSLEQFKNNEGEVKPVENGVESEDSMRKQNEILPSDSPVSENFKQNDEVSSNDNTISIKDKDEILSLKIAKIIEKPDANMQSVCDKNEEKFAATTEETHNKDTEMELESSSNNDNEAAIEESPVKMMGEENMQLDVDGSSHEQVTVDPRSDKLESGKRKLTGDDTDGTSETKKTKLNQSFGDECTKPKKSERVFKGATFWPCNWRKKLCSCSECVFMYKNFEVLFLLDLEDTVTAYEALGEAQNTEKQSQYEKGLKALSSLDRSQQINAITEYNKLKDKLIDFLKKFKEDKTIVKEEDIKRFFADIKPQREPDGVYFCRF